MIVNSLTAAEWCGLRSSYSYVPAVLRPDLNDSETHLHWGERRLAPDMPEHSEWGLPELRKQHSSRRLDEHHRKLLSSDAEEDVLHGVLSVVFWGFASGSDGRFRKNRALARAGQFLTGRRYRGRLLAPTPVRDLVSTVRAAQEAIVANELGRALTTMMETRFLGMSFASKILMFMAPETAAVYDAVVYSKLKSGRFLPVGVAVNPAPSGAERRKATAYQAWCAYCTHVAAQLNSAGVRWSDWDGRRYPWRAVDVERAIFAMPTA